ncbi:MAG: disulfide bond formation protein B [Simkania negevensis]|nr:disulfide bond formation protein B [Simkania negevensis]
MDSQVQMRWNWGFLLILGISMLAVIFSCLAEGVWGISACMFCKWQRGVYVLVGVNALFGIFTPLKRGFLKVVVVGLVIGMVLGSVHTAIQWGKIESFCQRKVPEMATKEDFKGFLERNGVRCSEVSWELFGLPASLWNVVLSGSISFRHHVLNKTH